MAIKATLDAAENAFFARALGLHGELPVELVASAASPMPRGIDLDATYYPRVSSVDEFTVQLSCMCLACERMR